MRGQQEPIDVRRQRLGLVMRQLAEDLGVERRRPFRLEREVRELRARLATYETAVPKEDQKCQTLP
jgi:hypothetical protein